MLVNQDTEKKKKIWVSDVINGEESKWKRGDFVTISAGTGTGKSHFVCNELYEEARSMGERILFISNREKLKEQNRLGIQGKEETITIINYQGIESVILRGEKFPFDLFKYVVCDECHYFLTESSFNRNNDLSMTAICGIKNSVVIFMSATGHSFFQFLREEFGSKRNIHKYSIVRDFSRIKELFFFNKDEALQYFLSKQVKAEDKVLYFCNNVEKLYKLSKQYSDSLFIFSDPFLADENGELVKKSADKGKNDKYGKYLDREAIKKIIKSKTLHHQYTFTTTTLDNGIDLYGNDIKWIVCDNIRDFDTLIQCIGRKRFKEDDVTDKVYVIIKNIDNMNLNGMRKVLGDTLSEVNTFKNEGTEAWIKKCNRYSNSDYCIYDKPNDTKYGADKKINRAKYQKIKAEWHLLNDILAEDKHIREFQELNGEPVEHIAYIRYVLKLMNKSRYVFLDREQEKVSLEEYLESIEGKRLYKQEQKELIERMNVRRDGKQYKSRDTLNSSLVEEKSKYYLKLERDNARTNEDGSPNPNRNKTYWLVCKN